MSEERKENQSVQTVSVTKSAVDAGANIFVHTYNGMSGLQQIPIQRMRMLKFLVLLKVVVI